MPPLAVCSATLFSRVVLVIVTPVSLAGSASAGLFPFTPDGCTIVLKVELTIRNGAGSRVHIPGITMGPRTHSVAFENIVLNSWRDGHGMASKIDHVTVGIIKIIILDGERS